MPIQLVSRTQAPLLTIQFFERIFRTTKQYVHYPTAFTVTVIVVDKAAIKQLNHQYRGMNEVTDVLSFPYDVATGEIVLCYPQAVTQAKSKQVPLPAELQWLVIHGILHLLGYKHETVKDTKMMCSLEQLILQQL